MDLRTNPAGHYAPDAAHCVKEMPRRPVLDWSGCMVSRRAVSAEGQIFFSVVASCNSSEVICWFTASDTFRACKTAWAQNLVDPDDNNARLMAKRLHLDWGHASVS